MRAPHPSLRRSRLSQVAFTDLSETGVALALLAFLGVGAPACGSGDPVGGARPDEEESSSSGAGGEAAAGGAVGGATSGHPGTGGLLDDCGDGAIDVGEQCDGDDLDGASCMSLGLGSGTLACAADCNFDDAGCAMQTACGDGNVGAGEDCDDGNAAAGDGCDTACQLEGLACVPHETPGIADDAVRLCVCAVDAFCCSSAWDGICVGEAVSECAVDCGDPCKSHAGAGSDDAQVTECVCAIASACCTQGWTAACVTTASDECAACQVQNPVCGDGKVEGAEQCDDGNATNGDGCTAVCETEMFMCGNGTREGNEECDDGDKMSGDGCDAICQFEGTACVPHDTPGVSDEAVEQCVCAKDAFCCQVKWDSVCVTEAVQDCQTNCGDPCVAHANAGSNSPQATTCVCNADPFCCSSSWDAQCVSKATNDCNACGAPVCGDGQKEFPEQCDDGNTKNADGCSSTCQKENPVCGNGVVEVMEECDDDNTSSNDGCSAACQFEGFACVPHATPGVAAENAEACVCGLDPFCCQVAWDALCVQKAVSNCNVSCGDPCSTHANPGSNQVAITQCVCEGDAFCCSNSWDATCVAEAQSECGACGGGVCGNGSVQANEECDDGDTSSGDGCSSVCQYEGSVCVPHPWKGADNDAVVSCVCAADPFCCNNEWDAQCVDKAAGQCNAGCGSACFPHASPGSNDGAVTECVCALDPVCCQSAWDFICVLEAVFACSAPCN